jgi:hypothetical protein
MDDAAVSTAIVSVSAPGLQVQEATAAPGLRRNCNEFAARMVADDRGRFGFFVVVPMTTTAASLTETAYALDVLKADGVGNRPERLPGRVGEREGKQCKKPARGKSAYFSEKLLARDHVPHSAMVCRFEKLGRPVSAYGTETRA